MLSIQKGTDQTLVLETKGSGPMKTLKWFQFVTLVAAVGLLELAASAAEPNAVPGGVPQVTNGVATFSDGAVTPQQPAVPQQTVAQPCVNCPNVCAEDCGCMPMWHAFGEYLLLRPRNAGVEYAVPVNGPIAANQVPLQIGSTAVVNPEFQSGFRVGMERYLNECSSVSLAYTYYRNDANDGPATANVPYVLRSMVFHPSSADAATDWASGRASESLSFDFVDLDYHHSFWSCDCSHLNYLVGLRYAHLTERFNADFSDIITASAGSTVDFDGLGLRLGVDGQRELGGGFFVTARAGADLLGGQFHATYQQGDANTPLVATTDWREARFLTILEAEIGIGWQSSDGRFRTSIGYLVNDWVDTVKPSDYISSVQRNHYVGSDKIGDTSLIFDGLTAHVELAW
jgi:hypothetical protein